MNYNSVESIDTSNYWENFLFGIFTTELELNTMIDSIIEMPENHSVGFIIPSERTISFVQNAAIGLLGESSTIAVLKEFEKEVSQILLLLPGYSERRIYLERMKIRFYEPFQLIPLYQYICTKLFIYGAKYLETDVLNQYSQITQLLDLIEGVENIISKAYDVEKKLADKIDVPKEVVVLPELNFVNNFNSLSDYHELKSKFMKLAKLKSANMKPHLLESDIDRFIVQAFTNAGQPVNEKIKINFTNGEKSAISRVFYEFYQYCRYEYESGGKHKERYVRLLTDNFTGFEYKAVFANFSK